ncbi:MAG: hypothetical protein QM679_12680 [Patulibacter sp.]
MLSTLAQSTTPDTSSAAGLTFGMLVLIGVLSIVALTPRGRRLLMPLIAILLGSVVIFTSLSDAFAHTFSILTALGLFIGVTLLLGGLGALREGVALPPVEGKEPQITPQPPRVTPAGATPPPAASDETA